MIAMSSHVINRTVNTITRRNEAGTARLATSHEGGMSARSIVKLLSPVREVKVILTEVEESAVTETPITG